jgi:arabinofuranan 3-O-arabinosyltransferase
VWNGAAWLLLVAAAFLRAPGRASFDTKSDLAIDAGAFLDRSLHLWNPLASFGELQNQAYGYLLPQGSFAWIGQLLGVPAWVVQRLWVALLLVVAYEGTRRLFLALAGGAPGPMTSGAAVFAGLAYAGAPRVGGIAGVLSSEVTPPAFLPWAVLLVVAAGKGRTSPRTAGLGVGVVVLLMGGVNAVAVIACLPLVALAVGSVVPAARRRAVSLWTLLGVVAGVAWWLGPLLLLGRYSPPFLDFIETSRATTAPLGWANVGRGAVHWVAYTTTGAPSLPGAFALHTTALGVAVTWGVALLGVLGMTRPDLPARRMLVTSFCLGAIALTIGHAGVLQSPLTGVVQSLLDGSLSMLRNVHKIDPLVRLPIALGAGHAALFLLSRARRAVPRAPALAHRVVVAGLVVVATAPLALAPDRTAGWREVPPAWEQASAFIATERPGGTTLILPASGFGEQTWGRTVDEPFQSVARTPWVSRSQVPLSPPQTIRFLDAVIARTEDPGGGTALADILGRAGISTLLVRHDLLPSVLDPEVTRRVDAALAAAPGISRVATFGTDSTARIEVFAVDAGARTVETVEVPSLAWVGGGADDVVTAVESGLLARDRPAVMVGDAGPLEQPGTRAPDLVIDGLARRERAFGLVREATGPVLAASEPFTARRPVHDYPGTPGAPLAVAEYEGLAGVTASSSTASAETVGAVRPDQGAWAALDGDLGTAWRSDRFGRPVGQWWELDLGVARPVTSLALVASVNPFDGVPVRRVGVTTDDGQRVTAVVHPETGVADVRLSGGAVSRVRVTVDEVAGAVGRGSVGLVEVGVDDLQTARRVVVPAAGTGAGSSFVLRTAPSRRSCTVVEDLPSCSFGAARGQEEGGGVSRRLTLDAPASFQVSAEVRARPGGSVAALFDPLGDAVKVRADSVFGNDPAVLGSFAVDGDDDSHWLAQPLARAATLTLSTDRRATITGLSMRADRSVARLPVSARVSNGSETHDVVLRGGTGDFPALSGRSFTVTLTAGPGVGDGLPLGVGELDVAGLEGRTYRPDLDGPTGAPCGLGPALVVDGRRVDTRVDGTLRDVRDGRPLVATACGGPVRLGPGDHVVEWRPTDRFEVTTVRLGSEQADDVPVVRRETRVLVDEAARRVVQVGPGGEAVLRIAQNTNPGWVAELDGVRLPPIRVDGWQQGFVVPAGAGGDVRLTFAPDGAYRGALLGGGIAALLLVVGAVVSLAVDRRRGPSPLSPSPSPQEVVRQPDGRWSGVRRYGVFVVGCGLLGGVAALVGALSWAVPWVRKRPGVLAGGLLGVAALGQLVWVATGGSAVEPPVLLDLAVGVSVTVLVTRALTVPGPNPGRVAEEGSRDG